MEFLVLGAVEVRVDGHAIPSGGPKQRALLAFLLLSANNVVPVDVLVDEVWGENPPASARHSLEAYVSRLRRLFAGHGPSLVRRGSGYSIDLGGAAFDEHVFAQLADDAARAADEQDDERASHLAAEALALWRGAALADVALGASGQAEAARLEELRLQVLELRFDAELALERHGELVGELQRLVAQNPYRERFVEQLMLALYRSGRQADALDLYERTRVAMLDDLGLQPSPELQQLSGRIVRQELLSLGPSRTHSTPSGSAAISPMKMSALAFFGAAAVAALAFTASGSAPPPAVASTPTPKRVALVLPRAPSATTRDDMTLYVDKFSKTANSNALTTETFVASGVDPGHAKLEALVSKLTHGEFDLVIWVGDGPAALAFAPEVRALPDTRFVFVDASLETLDLNGVRNASAVRFADEQASELVGYMSGLIPPRASPLRERADVVSVVAGLRTSRAKRVVAGFRRGVRRALPGVKVLVAYSHELADATRCEQIANSQIDKGSDVVFATAGHCGRGALAVAGARGVWAIGDDEIDSDVNQPRPNLLVHTYTEQERAVIVAVDSFLLNTLPSGGDVVLGLADDYAVGIWDINFDVPSNIRAQVVRLCSSIRKATGAHAA